MFIIEKNMHIFDYQHHKKMLLALEVEIFEEKKDAHCSETC